MRSFHRFVLTGYLLAALGVTASFAAAKVEKGNVDELRFGASIDAEGEVAASAHSKNREVLLQQVVGGKRDGHVVFSDAVQKPVAVALDVDGGVAIQLGLLPRPVRHFGRTSFDGQIGADELDRIDGHRDR